MNKLPMGIFGPNLDGGVHLVGTPYLIAHRLQEFSDAGAGRAAQCALNRHGWPMDRI